MNSNCENSEVGFGAASGQDDLDFNFPLFLYGQTANEIPHDDQADDLDPLHPIDTNPTSTDLDHVSYNNLPLYQPAYHPPSSEDLSSIHQSDLRDLISYSLSSRASPRIEITCTELHHQHREHVQTAPVDISQNLAVPNYRENLSPASSTSSTSWHSEIFSPQPSPTVSPSASGGIGLAAMAVAELCPMLQAIHASGSPHTSPNTSPRGSITEETFLTCLPSNASSSRPGSRSTSPQRKRTYEQYQNPGLVVSRSRSPSPHTVREEQVTKTLYSTQEYSVYSHSADHAIYPEVKREPILEPLYVVPSLGWSNHMSPGMCSVSLASLPALERQLPSNIGQYELSIDVQPRQHHRAHYETEGSRGAVKGVAGGHPVVQLHGYTGREALALQVFIGTADERAIRPHAFYQVHRITGKTVTTSSQEKILNGTKILELQLEPKDNMQAVVDCAGILKLKNADIELRKGETDVGRKNTRVRLVFRVHIPQPSGPWLSLQVASHPIECSQRSAHESPTVERQDLDSCSVLGGVQMILTGQNFTSESRVVFTEKTQEGLEIWEMEATVDREKSKANMLYLEIPSYRDRTIYHQVKVNFYVLNGKRKRSQPQHFTYMPLAVPLIKAEPVDEYQYSQLGCGIPHMLGMSPQSCHHLPQIPTSHCAMPAQIPQRTSSPTLYPPCLEYQLLQPSALCQSQVEAMATPANYQLSVDHLASTVNTSCLVSNLKHSSYQHVVAGHNYHAAGSVFPCVDGVSQRSYGQKSVSPVHGFNPQQPVLHQRAGSSGSRVTVKRENLDQACLDDVNELIRKDLIFPSTDQ